MFLVGLHDHNPDNIVWIVFDSLVEATIYANKEDLIIDYSSIIEVEEISSRQSPMTLSFYILNYDRIYN